MLPPSAELRGWVLGQFASRGGARPTDEYSVDEQSEARLHEVLERLAAELSEASDQNQEQEPAELLSMVEAWAGLASYATVRTYGPESPWPSRGWAGWSDSITKRLRDLCHQMEHHLATAALGVGADGWSIGLAFPWGVTVSLSWSRAGTGPLRAINPASVDDELTRGRRALERLRRAIR